MNQQIKAIPPERMPEPGMASRSLRLHDHRFLMLLAAIGALLLFIRLDDIYLWQDEAETAVISKHLLAYGLPLASDGHDWVQQTDRRRESFTASYVWTYHPWLQFGLTALSFAALGPTTWAARLPFALFGLLTIVFFHGFVLRWLGNRRTARVATLLLVLCVPFLLLARQSRYYTLAAFFTLLTIDAYLHLRAGRKWAVPYFVLSATLLYHGHYGAFFPTLVALGIHAVVSPVTHSARKQLALAFVATGGLVSPWAYFARVWNHGQVLDLGRFVSHLVQYALYISVWIFPLVLAVLLVFAWTRRHRQAAFALSAAQASFCELAGLIVAINLLSLAASAAFDWVFFRYVTHLIPLLLAALAVVVVLVIESHSIAGCALLVVLVACNGVHILPYNLPGLRQIVWSQLRPSDTRLLPIDDLWIKAHRLRSELLMYSQELTHPYRGPNEGIVQYLSAHAQPRDTVLANYEELPLMFYTNLRVYGGLAGFGLGENLQPDWIVVRRNGPYRDELNAMVASGSYQHIPLPYPDIHWENRPEPGQHHYLTVQSRPPVNLYRRRDD